MKEQSATFSTRAVRSLLLPLASFYTRASAKDGGKEDQESIELLDREREVIADAAGKFVVETQGVLRAWRISGDTRPDRELLRDPKTGLWPEPSVSFVGEVMAAFGVLDQDSAESRRQLEIARMETELEKERLCLERARLEYMSACLRNGVAIDVAELQRASTKVVTPPTLRRLAAMEAKPKSPPVLERLEEPQMQVLAMSTAEPMQAGLAVKEQTEAQAASTEKDSVKARIQDCVRVAFCDMIWCVLGLICKDGKFDRKALGDDLIMDQLLDCLMEFVCSLLRCIAVALCPPEPSSCLPRTANCDFAVEEVS